MTERYVCIHGHFYQPPRENPWTGRIDPEPSAYPYPDWNERITTECYAPNAAAPLLDVEGHVVAVSDNYARISFDFAPTLLAWLERHAPRTYQAIRAADQAGRRRFSGHGTAIAHPYVHMILPLADPRDRRTCVLWGLRDFEFRFGRKPEGLWLPETAVDLATLEVLAELGLRFTILGPHQARRVRRIGDPEWTDVTGERIDPSRAYLQRLPSGQSIALFFYDGPISRSVAFEETLTAGTRLVRRLMDGFSEARTGPQIVSVATDGETFGHHRRSGALVLAEALHVLENAPLGVRLTVYGEYLERHPPTHEVEILENTSWSCPHGVERWRSDCGCRLENRPGWHQAWRAPLRAALDDLRDALAVRYETATRPLLRDPWDARDDFISVHLDPSPENVRQFFERHARRDLTDTEKTAVLRLLQMQREALLMYMSDAWFFDDIAGLEAVYALRHAARAISIAREVLGEDVEPAFRRRLAQAPSNDPRFGDGEAVYMRRARGPWG